jgi:hypothetical protein
MPARKSGAATAACFNSSLRVIPFLASASTPFLPDDFMMAILHGEASPMAKFHRELAELGFSSVAETIEISTRLRNTFRRWQWTSSLLSQA